MARGKDNERTAAATTGRARRKPSSGELNIELNRAQNVENMAVQALVTSILSLSAPRCPPIIAQAPAPTATAGEDVARWCVSSGRPQAAIAVSAATTLSSAMADFWLCARQLSIEEGAVGRQCVLALPYLGEAQDPRWFNQVMQHINDCSEVCEYLGQSLTAAGNCGLLEEK